MVEVCCWNFRIHNFCLRYQVLTSRYPYDPVQHCTILSKSSWLDNPSWKAKINRADMYGDLFYRDSGNSICKTFIINQLRKHEMDRDIMFIMCIGLLRVCKCVDSLNVESTLLYCAILLCRLFRYCFGKYIGGWVDNKRWNVACIDIVIYVSRYDFVGIILQYFWIDF